MTRSFRSLVCTLALTFIVPTALHAQASEKDITKRLENLRSLPEAKHSAEIGKLALDIRALPAGLRKLQLADSLVHLSTEGDPGQQNLQDAATTLATALKENPIHGKDGKPASPYLELAKLVRYEGMTTDLTDPQYDQAQAILTANDADIEKADFTLTDMHNKKWTLSQLHGKIVMVNFWATWCPPCRAEMPNLNAIYNHFQPEGLVILSITDEEGIKVSSFLAQSGLTYPILLDPLGKIHKQFHIDGIPQSFVFDREGKLVARSIDMRTQRQFLNMLAKGGLKPM